MNQNLATFRPIFSRRQLPTLLKGRLSAGEFGSHVTQVENSQRQTLQAKPAPPRPHCYNRVLHMQRWASLGFPRQVCFERWNKQEPNFNITERPKKQGITQRSPEWDSLPEQGLQQFKNIRTTKMVYKTTFTSYLISTREGISVNKGGSCDSKTTSWCLPSRS